MGESMSIENAKPSERLIERLIGEGILPAGDYETRSAAEGISLTLGRDEIARSGYGVLDLLGADAIIGASDGRGVIVLDAR